jgi:hypothetical protein
MSDPRDLETASQRFKIAEEGRIDYLGLEWPGLDNFQASLGHYWRLASTNIQNMETLSDLRQLWDVAGTLARAPIHPPHPSVGLSSWLSRKAIAQDSELARAREACIDAGVALLSERHPAAELGNLLETLRFLRVNPEKGIAIVAPKKHHAGIRDSLDMGDLSFRLIAANDFKRAGTWEVAVYMGPQYAAFSGTPIALRRREAAWMYDAPAALHTIQVLWAGERFDLADYQVWDGVELKLGTEIGPTRFRTDISRLVSELLVTPPSRVIDGVESFDIDFADGYRASFSTDFGPKPHAIATDDYDVEIHSTSINKVREGDVLLMRLDSAARSFVRAEARRTMGEREYDHAVKLRDEFKTAIVAAAKNNDAETHLLRANFANPSYYMRVCEDPHYIAPDSQETYVKLCMALRVEPDTSAYQTFVGLRTYHRNAGVRARALLITQLISERSWEDAVHNDGYCRMTLADVGEVLIAAVMKISESRAALSALGRVFRNGVLLE